MAEIVQLKPTKVRRTEPDFSLTMEVLRRGVQLDPSWRIRSECRDMPGEWFFAEQEKSPEAEAAKQCCEACAVQDECLAFALTSGEMDGIWGGVFMTPRRFYTIRRKLRKQIGLPEAS